MRTYVYVDGYNLYYGALKRTPYKWLNLVELAKHLVPRTHTIERVKYFTARASGAVDPGVPIRQRAYLLALDTLQEVEVYFGHYLSKTIWRPIINFPVAGATIHSPTTVVFPAGNHRVDGGSLNSPKQLPVSGYPRPGMRAFGPKTPVADALITEVHTMEEKGSDVNLGAHLLNDAWKGAFEAAMVISNDSDLVTPIKMVSVDLKKPVFIVCPGRWEMSKHLARVATYRRHIRRSMLSASQFPDPIPGTTIRKPATWCG